MCRLKANVLTDIENIGHNFMKTTIELVYMNSNFYFEVLIYCDLFYIYYR